MVTHSRSVFLHLLFGIEIIFVTFRLLHSLPFPLAFTLNDFFPLSSSFTTILTAIAYTACRSCALITDGTLLGGATLRRLLDFWD